MNAETELAATDEGASLCHDVRCILIECHRDRGITALRADAKQDDLQALADVVARRLAPRIGGRYVPKGHYREGWQQRAKRDAEVWSAFNGRNHAEVMRQFNISRRLLYSILSLRRRPAAQ